MGVPRVTGSRIERTTFDTTSEPTHQFDAEFINVSGFNNTADAINAMPIVVASGTSLAESSGRSSSRIFADIYGLGTQRTLTLSQRATLRVVNLHRQKPAPRRVFYR